MSMKTKLHKTTECHNLIKVASRMDGVTDSVRIRRCFDLLYEEVRHYMKMLSHFFRRLFGLRVREDDYECESDANACESQSSCVDTEPTSSSHEVDVNYENEHENCMAQSVQPHATFNDGLEIADIPESEDANVSLYVNFDASEFPLGDQDAYQQDPDKYLDDNDSSSSIGFTESESELSLSTSESTEISDQLNVISDSKYVPQPMLFIDQPWKDLKPDWGPSVGPGKKMLELLRHAPDCPKRHLPNMKKEADIPLPDDDVCEWNDCDEKAFCEKNARKSVSQECTSTPKKGNHPLRYSCKMSCGGSPDQCHQMLGVPQSEAKDVVHTNAPPRMPPIQDPSEENTVFKFQAKPKKNVWAKVEPKFTMGNSFNKEPTGINDSMNDSMNESYTSETNADFSFLSQDVQTKQKHIPNRAQFNFKPRSDLRTKDKYTYTFETYSTLSECKILKCQNGRFEQEYCNCTPSDPSPKQWGVFMPLVRHKAVLAKPEDGVTIEPHFDLSCLDNETGGFLYEAPSAFERAAYRMDDQIAPEHCKKGTRVIQNEKVKVKRRGVPNKHLINKKKEYEYVVEVPEEDVDTVDVEACDLIEQMEDSVHEVEDKVEVEDKKISPRMDFRHYETVPVAVVQKKKQGDDIETQYAVKKKNKNKNKNKPLKNMEKDNSTCENIRTALLGGDTGRPRGRNRVRYN